MKTPETFAIQQDPSNPENYGILWETSGTEGGYTSAHEARKSAVAQGGKEASDTDAQTWSW